MDENTTIHKIRDWMNSNPSKGGFQVKEIGETLMVTKKAYRRPLGNGQKCLGEDIE